MTDSYYNACQQLQETPSLLEKYQKFVIEYWTTRKGGEEDSFKDLFVMSVGLGGETGEVLELLKKKVRDGKHDQVALAKELGDVLYYLTRIADYHGMTLEEIMQINMDKLEKRRVGGKSAA